MANNDFKTAAAKLLEQHEAKSPAAEAIRVESTVVQEPVVRVEPVMKAKPAKKIPITASLLFALAKKPLTLALVAVCSALMWLIVPELLVSEVYKVVNITLGIVMGLTYGIILTFPRSDEGVARDEQK